jgi:hypothetical protein
VAGKLISLPIVAPVFGEGPNDFLEERTMVKLSLFGVAVIAACAVVTAPAVAEQGNDPAIKVSTQRVGCASHTMGNPYSRETDYWDWSAWQARGGWDARNDFKCSPGRVMR